MKKRAWARGVKCNLWKMQFIVGAAEYLGKLSLLKDGDPIRERLNDSKNVHPYRCYVFVTVSWDDQVSITKYSE